MDQEKFQELIVHLLGTDNNMRDAAGKEFADIPIEIRLKALWDVYSNQNLESERRSSSLILIRRLLTSSHQELWERIGAEAKVKFLEEIPRHIINETDFPLRKRLTDIVAEIARETLNHDNGVQEWRGAIQLVEYCFLANRKDLLEVGLQLLEIVPNILGVDTERHVSGIGTLFYMSLSCSTLSTKALAVRSMVSFISENEESELVMKAMCQIIPYLIEACQVLVEADVDDDGCLQSLCDLIEAVPETMVPYIEDIAEFCLKTISNSAKDEEHRHSALEVMVCLCEEASDAMKENGAQYLLMLVQECLKLMTDLNYDATEWSEVEDSDEDDDEDTYMLGEMSLGRICGSVGDEVFQPLLENINQMVKDDGNSVDWRCRYAAIMALSAMGNDFRRKLEPVIPQIISDLVLPATQDVHPRVRFAACNCLGQMCTDYAPTVQKKCGSQVVSALLESLINLNHHRVAARASAALINFCDDCPKKVILIYLKPMMDKLGFVLEETFKAMMENGRKMLLEQVISTIGAIAEATNTEFLEYYDALSVPLKYIIVNLNSDRTESLRTEALDCFITVGLAVGREKFGSDATELMEILLNPNYGLDLSDTFKYAKLLSQAVGPDFAQYLPKLMPHVFNLANLDVNANVNKEDDDVKEAYHDHFMALEMLTSFATNIGPSFAPYVEDVASLALIKLDELIQGEIRIAAAECLPALLKCVEGLPAESGVFSRIFPALIDFIESECDVEVLPHKLEALIGIIDGSGPRFFTETEITAIFRTLQSQLEEHEEREADIESDSEDEEENELELEEMGTVIIKISDIIHSLFKQFGPKIVPYFEQMASKFGNLMHESRTWRDRQCGACIFADLVEFGGEEAILKFQDLYVEHVLRNATDERPEVRQAANYTIGMIAAKGGPNFAGFCAKAVELLSNTISIPNARETEENLAATENAISAVTKILKFNASSIDVNSVIPSFLQWLPVYQDADEVPLVYSYFCDLVESNNPVAFGTNNQNLPKIFDIILEAFEKEAFVSEEPDEELVQVKGRLINIIKAIRQNDSLFAQILAAVPLSDEKKQILQELLS